MKDLKDTIGGMLSDDWRKRKIAEYEQLSIRIEKLKNALKREDLENPSKTDLLYCQLYAMQDYHSVLNYILTKEGLI